MQIVPQMKLSGVYLDFVDFIFILVVFCLKFGEACLGSFFCILNK